MNGVICPTEGRTLRVSTFYLVWARNPEYCTPGGARGLTLSDLESTLIEKPMTDDAPRLHLRRLNLVSQRYIPKPDVRLPPSVAAHPPCFPHFFAGNCRRIPRASAGTRLRRSSDSPPREENTTSRRGSRNRGGGAGIGNAVVVVAVKLVGESRSPTRLGGDGRDSPWKPGYDVGGWTVGGRLRTSALRSGDRFRFLL